MIIGDDTNGIQVNWIKSSKCLDIHAWHNRHYGMGGAQMTIRKFFDTLGITEKDCKKALE